ncbi:hypothetical protein P8452_62259 [Trifolium repens]|nr:hypothetical protein P8452_62259 [Trifolium repens]
MESDVKSLKWASIQRLPTVARLRRGLLTTPQGDTNEIDVHNIGLQERTYLLQRLVTNNNNNINTDVDDGDVDNDQSSFLLLKLMRDRIDRAGVDIPTIEVRFEHLNVQSHVQLGKRALPTITNYMLDILEAPLKYILRRRKPHLNILQDVSGIIKHSRMTLLLGPPSSGKTTLLLALAGKLDPNLKFTGKVSYNGHEMNEFVPQRTAAYASQNDVHLGELTVRETLAFSARVQGVGPGYDMLAEVCRREKEENIIPDPDIDIYMKAVATEDQRANVVTEYILKILGLDICGDTMVGNAMLKGISKGQRKCVTIGEMLVGPIKALFMDEISIGPCEQVLGFFASMGFICPERKTVVDFLQEVTSRKDQEQYWIQKEKPYKFVTAKEFADAFESYHVGISLYNELATQFDKSKSHPSALTTKKYGIGKWELFKACLSREYLLMKRNSLYYIFKLCQIALVAIITLTVFLPSRMHHDSVTDGGIYAGALLYGKVGIWLLFTYSFIGDPNAVGRTFLLLVLVNQMATLFCRLVAAIGRDMAMAATLGTFSLGMLLVAVSKDNIRKWWLWEFWISPTMYGQNALLNNEFHGKTWRHVPPNSTEPLGVQILKSRGFFTQSYWYWIGFMALIGYTLLFVFGHILALTFLNPLKEHQVVKSIRSLSTKKQSVRDSKQNQKRGMVLPFEPQYITFDEVTYSVDMPKETKNQGVIGDRLNLFKGVSGAFRSEITTETRKMFVEEIMELVDLTPLRDTIVGLPGANGLSTQQRKRLTIAVELVANPSIIFMDQPTSGLDARSVAIVMRAIRNIVDNGRTIVCAIHQPNIDIFQSFDELFLMKQGGQVIYAGPIGHHSSSLISYFEGIHGVNKFEDGCNPATWMLEVTSPEKEMELGIDFFEVYKDSELYRRNKDLISELSIPAPDSEILHFPSKFLFTIVSSVFLGCMFFGIGSKMEKQQDIFNSIGSMLITILLIGIKNANSVQAVVSTERVVFYRENSAGMYSSLAYAVGQALIEIPYVLLQALIYGTIIYAMIGSVIPPPKIPIWWRWFYWANPVAWSFNGLATSQFGVAAIVVGFTLTFALVFVMSIKMLNFRSR